MHLDFYKSLHTLHYQPRHFTESIPDPRGLSSFRDLKCYQRPKFDENLTKKVKNLALGDVNDISCGWNSHADTFREELC